MIAGSEIMVYGGPVLMVMGTVGNVVAAVVVIRSKQLWKHTTSLYIVALAIMDTLTLNFSLLLKNNFFRNIWVIDHESVGTLTCRLLGFFYHFLPEFAAWILVNMAAERLVAVYAPFKVKVIFTKHNAMWGLLITVVLLITNCAVWFYEEVPHVYFYCYNQSAIKHNFKEFSIQHFVVGSAIPFLFLSISSTFLVSKVVCNNRKSKYIGKATRTKISRMTLMMVFLASTFLLLTAPANIMLLLLFYDLIGSLRYRPFYFAADFALHLNYMINFYVYSVSNPRFRGELKAMAKCKCG